MDNYKYTLNEFYKKFGEAKKVVLATSQNDKVTARTVSCLLIEGAFYFQTDKNLVKYEQILANPLVALCTRNIQVEGVATILGHPLEESNRFFATAFEKNFKGSFDAYSALSNEVVIKVNPKKITLWEYEGEKPFRMFLNIESQTHIKEYYVGE